MKRKIGMIGLIMLLFIFSACAKEDGKDMQVSEGVHIIEGTYIVRNKDREPQVMVKDSADENLVVENDVEEVVENNVPEDVANEDASEEKPKENTEVAKDEPKKETPKKEEVTPTPSPSQPVAPSQPAHTHSYSSSVTTQATCSEEGVKTYRCSCGHSYTESIPCTAHSYVETKTEATCTSSGDTTKRCQTCGHVLFNQDSPALGHNYSTQVTVNATCETEGSGTRTCQRCGDTSTFSIPAYGHSWSTSTYTLNGVKITEVKCSVYGCFKVQSRTEEPIEGSQSILDEDNQASIDDEFANLGNLVPGAP